MTTASARSPLGAGFLGFLLVAFFGAAVVYLLGFQFLLENGTLLVGGLLFIAAVRLRSWWPAALLVAQVPFQGLLKSNLGIIANAISLAIIVAFLSRYSAGSLGRLLLGTWVQRLAFLTVLGLSISYIWSEHDLETFIFFFQKVLLFFIVGAIVWGFDGGRRVRTIAWVLILATGTFFLLSEVEFYLGYRLVPVNAGSDLGVYQLLQQGVSPEEFAGRLRGAGRSMGENRLAFIGLLPTALGVVVLMNRRLRPASWWSVLLFLAILATAFGVIASGSRSATLGLLVVLTVVVFMRRGGRRRLSMTLVAFVLGLALILQSVPALGTGFGRLFLRQPETAEPVTGLRLDSGRVEFWKLSVSLFRENPVAGIGLLQFSRLRDYDNPVLRARRGFEPHSGLLQLLVETGLVGTAPFLSLFGYSLYILASRRRGLSEELDEWRVAFLAAYLGMTVVWLFNSYHFERYFWVAIGFAGFLEAQYRRASKTEEASPPRSGPPKEHNAPLRPAPGD